MGAINDLYDFQRVCGYAPDRDVLLELALNAGFAQSIDQLELAARELVDSVVLNEEGYQRFIAATQDEVDRDKAQFDFLVPPKHKKAVRKFYQLVKAYEPDAYRAILPFRTILGCLDDATFDEIVVDYIPRLEYQISISDTSRIINIDHILCRTVRAQLIQLNDLLQDFQAGKGDQAKIDLWSMRYRNSYIRILRAAHHEEWYDMWPAEANFRNAFNTMFLRTLLMPIMQQRGFFPAGKK